MGVTGAIVVFSCKGCGKEIIRPEGKVGGLVKCSRCQIVNHTPGIAMQAMASELQLTQMRRSLKMFRLALWLPFCAIIPLAFAAVLSGLESLAYLVEAGLVLFLCFCMVEVRGFLGYSKAVAFFLFVCLPPIWLGLTFLTYFRFARRVKVLVLNGARPVSANDEIVASHTAK